MSEKLFKTVSDALKQQPNLFSLEEIQSIIDYMKEKKRLTEYTEELTSSGRTLSSLKTSIQELKKEINEIKFFHIGKQSEKKVNKKRWNKRVKR